MSFQIRRFFRSGSAGTPAVAAPRTLCRRPVLAGAAAVVATTSLFASPAEAHDKCDSLANAATAAGVFYPPAAGFQVGYYLAKFVDADYMARVARVNAACLAELAWAPAPTGAPSMRAAVSYDTQLSWSPVAGAAGYEIVWRKTTEPEWTGSMPVGPDVQVLETRRGRRELIRATVEKVSADSYFFGVRSISASGHRSRVSYPTRP